MICLVADWKSVYTQSNKLQLYTRPPPPPPKQQRESVDHFLTGLNRRRLNMLCFKRVVSFPLLPPLTQRAFIPNVFGFVKMNSQRQEQISRQIPIVTSQSASKQGSVWFPYSLKANRPTTSFYDSRYVILP